MKKKTKKISHPICHQVKGGGQVWTTSDKRMFMDQGSAIEHEDHLEYQKTLAVENPKPPKRKIRTVQRNTERVKQAIALLPNLDETLGWILTKNKAFGNKTPLEATNTEWDLMIAQLKGEI